MSKEATIIEEKVYELTEAELNVLLVRAGEEGAKAALRQVWLHDDEAQRDIRDLRDIVKSFRSARSAAMKTVVQVITTAFLAVVLVGVVAWLRPHFQSN